MKLHIVKVVFLLLSLLIGISGCGTVKILNVSAQKVHRQVPTHDINSAIKLALQKRGWKVVKNESNKIIAFKRSRSWSITIALINTNETYSIEYQSSKNLKYDKKSQSIHPVYNKYIKRLKKQIDLEIQNVKITKLLKPKKNLEAVEEDQQVEVSKFSEELQQDEEIKQTSSQEKSIDEKSVEEEVEIW